MDTYTLKIKGKKKVVVSGARVPVTGDLIDAGGEHVVESVTWASRTGIANMATMHATVRAVPATH